MLRKIISVLLTVSFFIVSISGVILMIDKRSYIGFKMHHFHELFAIIMLVSGVIHFVLNFKAFTSYLKITKVSVVFSTIMGIVILLFIILMNIEPHH